MGIADVVRFVGNMGSHYGTDKAIKDALREVMMDMLDQLIEYIFIIPEQVDKTKMQIAIYQQLSNP